jgi:hypothetical protein
MKNFFPGHYLPTDDDLRLQWEKGIFIFDTNVLLNIYAYPEKARMEFLDTLESLCAMTWIPYQVMLEFHRNRFKRISSANKSVVELRDLIKKSLQSVEQGFKSIQFEKRDTGIDNIDDRISKFKLAGNDILDAVQTACEKLAGANLNDAVAHRLSQLYSDRVGQPPKDQEELQKLLKDAEHRFDQKIPPGFADAKDKNAVDYHRGLRYESKYGDLIVWRQIINHIREVKATHVIFVTAERKNDFWLKDDRDNTIGPLPELVEEFFMETGCESFWMYSPEQFLEQAKIRDNKLVSSNTIDEVREVSLKSDVEEDILELPNNITKMFWRNARSRMSNILLNKYFATRYPKVEVKRDGEMIVLMHDEFEANYTAILLESDDLDEFSKLCSNLIEPLLYDNFVLVVFFPYKIWSAQSVLARGKGEFNIRKVMKKNSINHVVFVPHDGQTIMDIQDIFDDI